MKMTKIALAVAALAAAPSAFALTPAQVAGDPTTVKLWLSGASAPTATVYKGVMTLCAGMTYKNASGVVTTNPGTIDAHLYLEKTTAGGLPGTAGNSMAYTCTVDTGDDRAGLLENKQVVVYHSTDGGSFNYVAPHLTISGELNPNLPGNLKRTPNVEGLSAATKCAAVAAENVVVDISGQSNTVGVYRGCSTTIVNFSSGQIQRGAVTATPDRPEGGYSDTEYMINKLNLGITTDVTAIGTELATNIGQAFGVAVSYPLYAQLQKNDGIINTTAADGESCDGVYTAGACQPNLPSQRYTTIANKDSIAGVTGALFGAVATPPGTSGKIQFHRRAPTSGSQSASNIRFLNKPCAMGEAGGGLEPAGNAHDTTYVNVVENSGSGDVKTGLTAASNAGEFGLGTLSMENVPGTDKWAYVKLDGVSPNSDSFQRANALNGSYSMWYELVSFKAADAFDEGKDLITAVDASLGNPEITNLTGLFITPGAGPLVGDNVSLGYRSGKSCQPAIQ